MPSTSPNPYAPPVATLAEPQRTAVVVRDGRDLRVARSADEAIELPDRCVRCNAAASGYRADSTLVWTTPWMRHSALVLFAAAFVLAGLPTPEISIGLLGLAVLLMLAAIVTRKRILVVHGVCERHLRFRRRMHMLFWILLAVTFAFCAGAIVGWTRIGYAGLSVLAALIVVGLIANGLRAWSLRVAKLSADTVWLRGTRSAFRASFPAPDVPPGR